MMSDSKIEPVCREVLVQVSPERAFRAFTEDIGQWWPSSHHIGKVEMKRSVLEPRPGGRWYEVGVDGSECMWGKVLVWEPPRRLVLAWQISAEWQYDPALATEVEVRFTSEGPGRTRCTLEHRLLEKFGPKARDVRNMIDSEGGWAGLLALFAKAAEGKAG